MARRQDGSVPLKLIDGRELTLRLDWNAICELDELGIDFEDLKKLSPDSQGEEGGEGESKPQLTPGEQMKIARGLLCALLKSEHQEMTVHEAGKLCSLVEGRNLAERNDRLVAVLQEAFADELDAAQEVEAKAREAGEVPIEGNP